MSEDGSDTRHMHCPRCGYDLAGMVASWSTSCPLQCTCTECGFEIDLSELNARGDVPDWFVAAAPGARGWIRRLPGTMLRMTVPFWPWRTLKLLAFTNAFGPRQALAWSVAVLVCLAMLVAMVLVVPVEGWNIALDIETRVKFRELNRGAIASHEARVRQERILDPHDRPRELEDPGVKSVLATIDDPLAIPMGATGDSLKRLWAMARFEDVPPGEGIRLYHLPRLKSRTRPLIPGRPQMKDPWEFAGGLRRLWTPLLVLPVAIVVMSGFGLRISRGFDRVRTSGWVQLRLALLSSCILFPPLLYIGVRLAMSDALSMKTSWSLAIRELRMIPFEAAGGGLLLLIAWWWGAYRMLQVRFAFLTAALMIFLITIASLILIPAAIMLYWHLTGERALP